MEYTLEGDFEIAKITSNKNNFNHLINYWLSHLGTKIERLSSIYL